MELLRRFPEMSFRYWLYAPAVRRTIVGLLCLPIVGLTLLFGWRFWPDKPPSHEPQAVIAEAEYLAKNLDEDCRALLAAPPVPDPTPAQIDSCKDKETAQRYNYVSIEQAIRSANAAVYAAYIAHLQTCIGIIGAMLVTATLTASAIATWAAHSAARGTIDAAKATRDSVELSLRSFGLMHRPRLRVRNVTIPKLVDGELITIEGEIANVGDTNAFIHVKAVSVHVRRDTVAVLYDGSESPHIGTATIPADGKARVEWAPAGGHSKFSMQTDLIYRNQPRFYVEQMVVRGVITYSDTYPGDPTDLLLSGKRFRSMDRKTAFQRVFLGEPGDGPPYRFVAGEKPDLEREYED